jgi:hypothetical protein
MEADASRYITAGIWCYGAQPFMSTPVSQRTATAAGNSCAPRRVFSRRANCVRISLLGAGGPPGRRPARAAIRSRGAQRAARPSSNLGDSPTPNSRFSRTHGAEGDRAAFKLRISTLNFSVRHSGLISSSRNDHTISVKILFL